MPIGFEYGRVAARTGSAGLPAGCGVDLPVHVAPCTNGKNALAWLGVQFRKPENSRPMDRSHHRRNRRSFSDLVDASAFCAVTSHCGPSTAGMQASTEPNKLLTRARSAADRATPFLSWQLRRNSPGARHMESQCDWAGRSGATHRSWLPVPFRAAPVLPGRGSALLAKSCARRAATPIQALRSPGSGHTCESDDG